MAGVREPNLQDEPEGNSVDALHNALSEPWLLPGPEIANWKKVAPNAITCSATVVGLSSALWARDPAQLPVAVASVAVAGLLDGLDGPVARALGTTSRFGAELDSISDVINFGVAPALLLHEAVLKAWGPLGWGLCLLFTVAVSCRLARFNAGVDFNASKSLKSFFMGVPAPAAALMTLLPLGISFAARDAGDEYEWIAVAVTQPHIVAGWNVISAYLSVSRVPTFSSKLLTRERLQSLSTATCFGLGFASIAALVLGIRNHWLLASLLMIIYVTSIPFSFAAFKFVLREEKRQLRAAAGSTSTRGKRSRSPAKRR